MKKTFTEIHLHTAQSSKCSRVGAEMSIPEFKKNGYDCVIITDHYSRLVFSDFYRDEATFKEKTDRFLLGYRTAKEIGEKVGLTVLLGAEFRFGEGNYNDYLVYGMSEEMFYKYPYLFDKTEKEFSCFANDNHLFFAQAHPFRDKVTRCNPGYLHGCEVFNAHPYHNSRNILAAQFCSDNSLIPTCGSDFHYEEGLCGCGMNFYGELNCIGDVVDKLFKRQYDLVIPSGYTVREKPEKYKNKKN